MNSGSFKIDMHTHSRISDGSLSLQELVDEATDKELNALAITDHDTLQHFSQIDKLSIPQTLKVYKGVELSCEDPLTHKTVHLLGYGLVERDSPLPFETLAQKTLEQRLDQSRYITQTLIAVGANISWEEVSSEAQDSATVYRGIIAKVLKRVEVGERYERFRRLYHQLKAQCDKDFRFPSYMEGLIALKESGAKVVLAHPGRSKALHLVPEMARAGLFGIERNHPDNTDAVRREVDELAKEFKLIKTGGSDYHGLNSPRALAQDIAPQDEVNNILELLSYNKAY